MNFDKLSVLDELDQLTRQISRYIDRALFVDEAAEDERACAFDSATDAKYALKRSITYSEIISDYLFLLKDDVNKLSELRNYLYAEHRA